MDFSRALVGGNARIDNGMIARYMSGKNLPNDMVQTTHGKMDANTARQLRKVLGTYEAGGLEKALGLGADATDDAVAEALGSTGGQKAYMQFMKNSGAVFSMDMRGAYVLSKDAGKKGREALELGQRVYERAVLTGVNLKDETAAKALEQQIIGEDSAMRGMAKDPVAAQAAMTKRGDMLRDFLSIGSNVRSAMDIDSDAYKAIGTISSRDSRGFQQAMQQAKKSYEDKAAAGDKDAAKSLEELRALETRIGVSQKSVQPVMIVASSIQDLANASRGSGSRLSN